MISKEACAAGGTALSAVNLRLACPMFDFTQQLGRGIFANAERHLQQFRVKQRTMLFRPMLLSIVFRVKQVDYTDGSF